MSRDNEEERESSVHAWVMFHNSTKCRHDRNLPRSAARLALEIVDDRLGRSIRASAPRTASLTLESMRYGRRWATRKPLTQGLESDMWKHVCWTDEASFAARSFGVVYVTRLAKF
jgi:hypothetical protein